MPLRKKLPKFLQRKNSGRNTQASVVHTAPLSPVFEHTDAIQVPPSPHGSPAMRPVPPPHSHVDDFGHHDMHHDDYVDDMHEPHSRLYETFSPSTDAHSVPQVIREGDDDHLHFTHSDGHGHHPTDGTRSLHPDELGMVNTERSQPAIFIAPSEQSHSSGSSSQKVTFLGDLGSHDRTPSTYRRALTTSIPAGDRSRGIPLTSSSLRYNDYGASRRHASDHHYLRKPPPRISRPERPYGFRYPYMILTDFGEGLEIGNEDDGFMRYEDYLHTSHLRRSRDDTYYIIPGSTPVVFHDEGGNEIYSVDAWKYNTPYLRKTQYIVQDEDGRELFRVGGHGSSRSSSDGYSSPDRVTYLPSGSNMHRRPPKYQNYHNRLAGARSPYRDHHAASPRATPALARSALFDEDDRTVSSKISSNPDIVVVNEDGDRVYDSRESIAGTVAGSRTPLTQSQYATEVSYPSRPESEFVDEYDQSIDRPHSPEYPWGTSGTSSTESDNYHEGSTSRRRSRVLHF